MEGGRYKEGGKEGGNEAGVEAGSPTDQVAKARMQSQLCVCVVMGPLWSCVWCVVMRPLWSCVDRKSVV